jgi:hypothetical protein
MASPSLKRSPERDGAHLQIMLPFLLHHSLTSKTSFCSTLWFPVHSTFCPVPTPPLCLLVLTFGHHHHSRTLQINFSDPRRDSARHAHMIRGTVQGEKNKYLLLMPWAGQQQVIDPPMGASFASSHVAVTLSMMTARRGKGATYLVRKETFSFLGGSSG